MGTFAAVSQVQQMQDSDGRSDGLSLEEQRNKLHLWQKGSWDAARAQRERLLAAGAGSDELLFDCVQSGKVVRARQGAELLPVSAILAVIGNGPTAVAASQRAAIGQRDVIVRFNDFVKPLMGPNRTDVHVVNGRVRDCRHAPLVINLECNWHPLVDRPIHRPSSTAFHPHRFSCRRPRTTMYCVPTRLVWESSCTHRGTISPTSVPSRGFLFMALLAQRQRVRIFGFRGDSHLGRPRDHVHHYIAIEHALLREQWVGARNRTMIYRDYT